ncbi:hypothetical protein [Actinoplanes sp. NPDC049265]|uniref:hypothetical protein n=1 Tax=Actinoplanes sp. NPDC049265 TaxID=3363902 RepID=UPI00371393B4
MTTAPDWDDLTLEMPVAGRKPDPLPEPEMHRPRVRRLLFAGLAVAVAVAGVLIIVSVNRDAPAAPRRAASASASAIDVIGGSSITVRTADLGEDLYRVRPAARESDDHGRIRLEVPGGPVELLLATGVAWDLGMHGPAETRTVDLAQARVSTVALYDGAARLDLRLPRPDGTLAVRLTSGVNQFALHTTGDAPVRVRVGSGAGRVVLPGQSHDGVAPGALFTPDDWSGAGNRIDLDAAGGMAQLTVSPG